MQFGRAQSLCSWGMLCSDIFLFCQCCAHVGRLIVTHLTNSWEGLHTTFLVGHHNSQFLHHLPCSWKDSVCTVNLWTLSLRPTFWLLLALVVGHLPTSPHLSEVDHVSSFIRPHYHWMCASTSPPFIWMHVTAASIHLLFAMCHHHSVTTHTLGILHPLLFVAPSVSVTQLQCCSRGHATWIA